MVFLAFDVFFMIFCIAMAFIFFVLLACCFPILARVAHAMTVGEGASENDIRTLPKYRYCLPNAAGTINSCRKREEAALLAHLGSGNIPELALSLEDSVSIYNILYLFTEMDLFLSHLSVNFSFAPFKIIVISYMEKY